MDTSTIFKLDALLVPLIMLVVQAVIAWVLWSFSKKFVTTEIFSQYRAKTEEQLEDMEVTVAALENQVGSLPSKESLHELSLQLSDLGGKLNTLSANISGQGQLMERIERPLHLLMEYQLTKGGSK